MVHSTSVTRDGNRTVDERPFLTRRFAAILASVGLGAAVLLTGCRTESVRVTTATPTANATSVPGSASPPISRTEERRTSKERLTRQGLIEQFSRPRPDMPRVDRVAVKRMPYVEVQLLADPVVSPDTPGQTAALAPADAIVFVVAISGDFQPHVRAGIARPEKTPAWEVIVFDEQTGRPIMDFGFPDGTSWPLLFDRLVDRT